MNYEVLIYQAISPVLLKKLATSEQIRIRQSGPIWGLEVTNGLIDWLAGLLTDLSDLWGRTVVQC